jgi:HEAT repeat protein
MGLFSISPEKVERWTQEKNVKKLLGCLKSDDAAVRRMATESLGKIGGTEVLDYCRQNAQSPDDKTRWHITQILGQITSPEAMTILGTVKAPGLDWVEKAGEWKKQKDAQKPKG